MDFLVPYRTITTNPEGLSRETERGGSVFVQVLFVGSLRFEAGVQIGVSIASLYC